MKLGHCSLVTVSRPWYYVGRRIIVAAAATTLLAGSLVTAKTEYGSTNTLVIQSREEPNIALAAIAIYLLGVATDFDLAVPIRALIAPIKMLKGENDKSDEDED